MWDQLVVKTVDMVWFLGWRALVVLLILAAAWLVVYLVLRPLQRRLEGMSADPTVVSFLINALRIVVLLVALIAALRQLGVATASLLTVLGAAGLAIALSLRSTLSNFAAGLILLSIDSVRTGDDIEVGDVRGRVVAIHSFHVLLDTEENQRILVPNSQLVGGVLRNNSRLEARRVTWVMPVPTHVNLQTLRQAVTEILLADSRVHREPAPSLETRDWSEQRWTLAVFAWTSASDARAVHQQLLEVLGTRVGEIIRTTQP